MNFFNLRLPQILSSRTQTATKTFGFVHFQCGFLISFNQEWIPRQVLSQDLQRVLEHLVGQKFFLVSTKTNPKLEGKARMDFWKQSKGRREWLWQKAQAHRWDLGNSKQVLSFKRSRKQQCCHFREYSWEKARKKGLLQGVGTAKMDLTLSRKRESCR